MFVELSVYVIFLQHHLQGVSDSSLCFWLSSCSKAASKKSKQQDLLGFPYAINIAYLRLQLDSKDFKNMLVKLLRAPSTATFLATEL